MKKYQFSLFYLLIFIQLNISAQINLNHKSFNSTWKFKLGTIQGAEKINFNDESWRTLDLPHDWSIEDLDITDTSKGRVVSGPFDSQAIGGKNSGFTVGGTAWYRKHFNVAEADSGKIVYINFDGIYMNSDVWINGHHIANQPYGYTANWYELTPYLNYGVTENVIAVEVKNEGINSRWYAGSGIYRNVILSIVDKIHIKPWGVSVQTMKADSLQAKLSVLVNIKNQAESNENVDIIFEVINSESEIVNSKKISTQVHSQIASKTKVNLTLESPELWSPETPKLYTLVCSIKYADKLLDKTETTFGIRTIEFDSEKGMLLNGGNIKLKGGAVHANNGPIGACSYYRAEERRVELMKDCGFNAIRCAHNPPSQAFLDACDRLGMLVIDETFDVWSQGWLPDDYQNYFNDWWKHDVRNLVLRDRNHPSIFAWGIRNQAKEAKDSLAIATGGEMANFIRGFDPSRPITANVTMFESWGDGDPNIWKSRDPFFENLDICGCSYQSSQYENVHERLPGRIQYSSEIDSRNAFRNWMRAIDHDYVIGNFTWTAMDFMGEVALGWLKPYKLTSEELFPWTNSFSGDLDICGYRKPRSYYRDILFENGSKLSLFVKSPKPSFKNDMNALWGWEDVKPSWNWAGHEGEKLTVVTYSACDSVQLYLNGELQGTKITNRESEFKAYWDVPYVKGELNAVGYINGEKVTISQLKTTSEPFSIRLTADRTQIKADNHDLCFITVEILDKDSNVVPYADNLVNFEIKGNGTIIGVGNGNPISLESFQQPYRKAYEGKCLLIIKSSNNPGNISVLSKSKGLKSKLMKIQSVR